MGKNSAIEWCHHTFNPWVGCTKVSPGCDGCYAEAWAKRTGHPELWDGERRLTSKSNWAQPEKWHHEAEAAGERRRVFCASLADVFDNKVPWEWRANLWTLIRRTWNLDWLLLTKRPMNIDEMLPAHWGDGYHNVWLGTTAEDAHYYRQRWGHLAAIPARVRFLSHEPALGPIGNLDLGRVGAPDWVICGGESGPNARPMHPDWARSARDQCKAAGVPFLFKQWGEFRLADDSEIPEQFGTGCAQFRVMCSNGFVGEMNLASAFLHKPSRWPQCFPGGEEADASCEGAYMRRVGKRAAGRLLDGVLHDGYPLVQA